MTSQNLDESQYPCIVSNSSSIFPHYLVLHKDGSKITIGREAVNDICINASHISRVHAEIMFNGRGNLEIKDVSRNGILYNGQKLPQDKPVELSIKNNIRLDFHDDLIIEILFHNPENHNENHSKDTKKDAGKGDASAGSFDHSTQNSAPAKGNFTEIFFLNELEDIDNISDLHSNHNELNLKSKSVEYTRGQYGMAGNKSSSYHNREQNSFTVFSDSENTSSVDLGSFKTLFKVPLPTIATIIILSLVAIIIAVLIF